jgi:hypothetical protein
LRRMTRLTNAFGKKWEMLYAMMALYFPWYNFCRVHQSLRSRQRKRPGLTGHIWETRELLR